MNEPPVASIVIPTRDRPDYLDVALGSIMPQARKAGAEVIVVSDGPGPATAAVADRHGAMLVTRPVAGWTNAARNTGVDASRADLIVFVDDDVEARPGWLEAVLRGARSAPEYDVFGGPIRPRLEGGGARSCGREPPPITMLDLGPRDLDADRAWGANMAIRRQAFRNIGPFNERIRSHGDEEEWERRYVAAGGRIRYLADAGLDHRRTGADSTIRALARAAYVNGI